jgi:hypothetical protein
MTKNGTPRMKWVAPEARWVSSCCPFDEKRHWRTSTPPTRPQRGLEDFVAHDLRHSLASDIRSRGGSLGDVGAALSHDSLASSSRYAHLYPEALKGVLQAVGRKKKPRRKAGGVRKSAHQAEKGSARKAA